ncbi:MAG: heparinase II/III family protein, partial [bacterium]|nr:heparinase II/III family protein [bacterium]
MPVDILISESEWTALRTRVKQPVFRDAVRRLNEEVDDFLARPVAVPEGPAGYYHDYFCPEHGGQFVFDPERPDTHRCPVDDALFTGEQYDTAWRWFANNRLSEAAFRLALRGRLEEKIAYLDKVKEILLGYAEQYAVYATVKRDHRSPGVVTYTTLDEAVWLLPLTWAFDMVRGWISKEEQEQVAERLFVPVTEYLVENHAGMIHNFSCWHNAAVGTVGVVLGRQDLVEFAVRGTFGFDAQVKEGLCSDGLWFEGSTSYHFYTLAALLFLVKATRHVPGLDLRDRPELRAMLRAPVECAFPDGSMPAMNDCWYFTSLMGDCCHGVPPAPAFYEVGYTWYGDRMFGQVLDRAYKKGARDSLDALLFGVEVVPQGKMEAQPSVDLGGSGYAILRSEAKEELAQRYLLLKYGPHGGGHGHPDKLSLAVYACGRRMSADLGTPGYGIELNKSWYRQTVSHSTVVVKGRSQPEGEGRLNAFRGEGPFQVADASVTWEEASYEGVCLRRVVLARPAYFMDVFLVEMPQEGQVDWVYRNAGMCRASVGQEDVGRLEGEGYEHIEHARRGIGDEDFQVRWDVGDAEVVVFGAGCVGEEVMTGDGPG